jgi:hypothetical protein
MLHASAISMYSVVSQETTTYYGVDSEHQECAKMDDQQQTYQESVPPRHFADTSVARLSQQSRTILAKSHRDKARQAHRVIAAVIDHPISDYDGVETFEGMRFFPVHDDVDHSCKFCYSRGGGDFLL